MDLKCGKTTICKIWQKNQMPYYLIKKIEQFLTIHIKRL